MMSLSPSSDSDGIDAQPCIVVRFAVILLDADWLEGSGPLDGPKPVGEGGEAVEVVTWLEVNDVTSRSSGRVVDSATAVLVISIQDAMLLIISATSLALGGVTIAVVIVDARTKILSVEIEAKVILVDLLSFVVGPS